MSMDVILLTDVGGVGRRGEVKRVSDGYAMNYLIPRGFAEAATKDRVAKHESARKAEEAKKAAETDALALAVKSLEAKTVTITAKATEKGGLFRAIGKKDIQNAVLTAFGIRVPESAFGELHIKTAGDHEVTVQVVGGKANMTARIEAVK